MSNETANPLSLCGVKNSPPEITRALTELSRVGPVIAPGGTTVCSGIAEGYSAVVTQITPDAENIGKPGGDLYKDRSSGAICFSAKFLARLAAGLGIEWDATKTRRLDSFQHPHVCSLVVGGRYRDYTGEWREISASHTLDLRDDAAHGRGEKDLARARRYIHQLCETMAQSRAIAKAGVDRALAQDDLGRPIFMAKVYRKGASEAESAAARAAMYGAAPGESVNTETGEVTVATQAEVRDTPQPEPDPVVPAGRLTGAGRRVSELSDDELAPLRDEIMSALEHGMSEPKAARARDLLDAVTTEMSRRVPF